MNKQLILIKTIPRNLPRGHSLAGRGFKKECSYMAHIRCILNESALRNLGWKNPEEALSGPVELLFNSGDTKTGEIIGVVKDFHFKSMHQEIEPLAFQLYPEQLSYMYIRVNPENFKRSVKESIQQPWLAGESSTVTS